uniref:receptor-like protein EIX2 isoform X2 n=1 Tax=Erigeron canadensis TaxID=72917 RepID=UPI001CB98547|nr:receptor-like protein EIX2 isoform X2 [Erigeron canadensis]
MGPQFPNWLQTQTHLEDLDLSNSSIRDTIPEWFQNISSHLRILDLSDNEIHGNLPRIIANNNTGYLWVQNKLCYDILIRAFWSSNGYTSRLCWKMSEMRVLLKKRGFDVYYCV